MDLAPDRPGLNMEQGALRAEFKRLSPAATIDDFVVFQIALRGTIRYGPVG